MRKSRTAGIKKSQGRALGLVILIVALLGTGLLGQQAWTPWLIGAALLVLVLAAAHAVAQLLLQRLARAGVIGDRGADLLLDGLHGAGAVGGDALGDGERLRQHLLGVHHPVDQPQARGLGGVDQARRKQ